MAPDIHSPNRSIQRHRFETRRRDLIVTGREQITPNMLRLALSGDLSGFQSLGFDDHVKLFFPDPVTGSYEPADGAKPLARDYTPRRFDVAAGTLVLDFALHGAEEGQAGPATAWAGKAVIGDRLVIGGPRGSSVLPLDFSLHLLIGDDTALPAIGRRLEELPAGARALMELIIINIGLQKGIIGPALFSMLVLMAIITTLMASPLFELVYGRKARARGELGELNEQDSDFVEARQAR